MKTRLAFLLLSFALTGRAGETAATPLFNGKNLDGWYVVLQDQGAVADQDTFRAEDGAIHVYATASAGTKQSFGGLLTQAEYADYHLTLEYKWGTKKFSPRDEPDSVRDAGVCYHVRGPDEIWPVCLECQIEEGDTGDVWVVHTRATSTVHLDNMNFWPPEKGGVSVTKGDDPKGYQRFLRNYCYEQSGWNRVEVIVRGDSATYVINGHVANRVSALKYWDATSSRWLPLTRGKILLQAEGAEIFYRNVSIAPLDPLPETGK